MKKIIAIAAAITVAFVIAIFAGSGEDIRSAGKGLQNSHLEVTSTSVPEVMNYQGVLLVNGLPPTDLHSIKFIIHPYETGITPKWGEEHENDPNDPLVDPVTGYFELLLGDGDEIAGVPHPSFVRLFDGSGGSKRWLETILVKTDLTEIIMTPRKRICSAPYAYQMNGVYGDEDGNVGIGTVYPGFVEGADRYLTLQTSGNMSSLELEGNGEETVGRIDFIHEQPYVIDSRTNVSRIEATKAGNLSFTTNESERLNISGEGHVKISADRIIGGVFPAPTLLVLGNDTEDPFIVSWSGNKFKLEDDGDILMDTDGDVGIGTTHPTEKLDVRGTTQTEILRITGGSDISEPFDVMEPDAIEPGMVVAIDSENPGKLKTSDIAYDRCVAGIVSGAGGIKPGLMLTQKDTFEGDRQVALTGRVYGLCDASYDPIEPGDLLTTSPTPGYAMKVADHEKAQGAIIGKAMTPLEEGQGLVLVLVSLQ